jgi:hypothetical protein
MADTAASRLNTAIDEYSDGASKGFTQAQTDVRNDTPPPNTTQTRDQQAALSKAQGAVAAAFSQLGQAAKMASDQRSREGLSSVVDLMKTTAITAESVCHQIRLQVGATNPNTTLLASFAAVLTSLAQLSPASVWQEPPGGQG